MRKIVLAEVSAKNFKNHDLLDLAFGQVTEIKGPNGVGKTSIGEIVSWTLGGVDMLGSKLDPTPTDRAVEIVSASVLLVVDDKPIKFTRSLVKGKAEFAINDIPKKATEYNDVVNSITGEGSVDLFLALYNPAYFPLMHWSDQRNMLFNYVSAPAQADVLKKMPELQAAKLKEALKKNNITDLDAFHKKNKTTKERELIAANSRVETLEGQLKGVQVGNIEELEEERKKLSEELIEQEKKHEAFIAAVSNQKRIERSLSEQMVDINKIKQKHAAAKEKTACQTCGSPVDEELKKAILSSINEEYQALVQPYKAEKLKFDLLELPENWNLERVQVIEIRIGEIHALIDGEKKRAEAVEVIEAARKNRDEVKDSLNESIFLLDAIKEYNALGAELQAEKVQALFTGIQIGLWDHKKNGEKTPFFTIMMNGKPYAKLSLGEKARAGLELIKVLSEQSEILAPIFFDNGESYTGGIPMFTQIIEATATAEINELKVEVIS